MHWGFRLFLLCFTIARFGKLRMLVGIRRNSPSSRVQYVPHNTSQIVKLFLHVDCNLTQVCVGFVAKLVCAVLFINVALSSQESIRQMHLHTSSSCGRVKTAYGEYVVYMWELGYVLYIFDWMHLLFIDDVAMVCT